MQDRVRAEAARLRALFEARGARGVETTVLQPADTLLDLYGEDIRTRAFTTSDPLRGEAMLRPDFTVPVVEAHLARAGGSDGGGVARYTYSGKVFRRQPEGSDRPAEYMQVGYELFGAADRAAADAEVFALFHGILAPMGLSAATGDIGLLRAAVRGLTTSALRRETLLRHLWRPRRFRSLLESYRAAAPAPTGAEGGEAAAPEIGLRTRDEVAARLAALAADAATPPIPAAEAAVLEAILALAEPAAGALLRLRDMAGEMPAIGPAVEGFARRLDALAAAGIDPGTLPFEAAYGRTTLEYYDGFVFGFYLPARPELPPVATGGRYDALTAALSGDGGVPAVGGVIRPGLIVELGLAPGEAGA